MDGFSFKIYRNKNIILPKNDKKFKQRITYFKVRDWRS